MKSPTVIDISNNHPWMGKKATGICAGDLRPAAGVVVCVRNINGRDFVNLQTPVGYVMPCTYNSIVLT